MRSSFMINIPRRFTNNKAPEPEESAHDALEEQWQAP